MSRTRRWSCAAVLAIVLLALNVASVAAYREVRFTVPGNYIVESLERITITAGTMSVRCRWSFGGVLTRDPFREGLVNEFASILSAGTSECSGGTIPEMNGLPWTMSLYRVLPNGLATLKERVTGLDTRIDEAGITIASGPARCRYNGNIYALTRVEAFGPLGAGGWWYGLWEMPIDTGLTLQGERANECRCAARATISGTFKRIEGPRIVEVN